MKTIELNGKTVELKVKKDGTVYLGTKKRLPSATAEFSYVPGEMDREALDALREELSDRARGDLAHLLNNALTPALMMLGMEKTPDLEEVRQAVARVAGIVKEVTRVD